MWSRLKYSLIHFGDLPSGGLQLSPPKQFSNGSGMAEVFPVLLEASGCRLLGFGR